MNNKIQITEQSAQPVLSIRTRSSVENLPNLIGECYGKIMQYMGEIGIEPADAPFVAYYNMDMKDLDLEIGFPIAKPVEGKGDIIKSEIPAGKYMFMMYKGPYAEMENPYNEMMEFMKKEGLKSKGVAYEFYFNSPADVPEDELLTKIVFPV